MLIPDEKHHLLIRSRTTRKLINGSGHMNELDSEPVAGSYTIELPTDNRKIQYKQYAEIYIDLIDNLNNTFQRLAQLKEPPYLDEG